MKHDAGIDFCLFLGSLSLFVCIFEVSYTVKNINQNIVVIVIAKQSSGP